MITHSKQGPKHGRSRIIVRCLHAVTAAVCFTVAPHFSEAQNGWEDRERFMVYANGVVADLDHGLEWFAGPDVDTSYYQAVKWVKRLQVDGGGWRMPTAAEMNTLYREPGAASSITPLLKTSATHIWTHQINEDLSLYLFRYMDPYGTRGFAVRNKGSQ